MYERILVPFDGSPAAERALAEAARLARRLSARLCLLHVVDSLRHTTGFEPPKVFVDEIRPAMLKAGQELLAKARSKIGDNVQVEQVVVESVEGTVAELIVGHAKRWNADLLVLGTHGRRGIERVVLGSDAEQVARTSPVPVMLVKADPVAV